MRAGVRASPLFVWADFVFPLICVLVLGRDKFRRFARIGKEKVCGSGGVGFLNAGCGSRALPISTLSLSPTTKGTRGLAAGFKLSKMVPASPISYAPTFGGKPFSLLDFEQGGLAEWVDGDSA